MVKDQSPFTAQWVRGSRASGNRPKPEEKRSVSQAERVMSARYNVRWPTGSAPFNGQHVNGTIQGVPVHSDLAGGREHREIP